MAVIEENIDKDPFRYWTVLSSKAFLGEVRQNLFNYERSQLGRIYKWLTTLIPFAEALGLDYTLAKWKETRDMIAGRYNSKLIQELASGLKTNPMV